MPIFSRIARAVHWLWIVYSRLVLKLLTFSRYAWTSDSKTDILIPSPINSAILKTILLLYTIAIIIFQPAFVFPAHHAPTDFLPWILRNLGLVPVTILLDLAALIILVPVLYFAIWVSINVFGLFLYPFIDDLDFEEHAPLSSLILVFILLFGCAICLLMYTSDEVTSEFYEDMLLCPPLMLLGATVLAVITTLIQAAMRFFRVIDKWHPWELFQWLCEKSMWLSPAYAIVIIILIPAYVISIMMMVFLYASSTVFHFYAKISQREKEDHGKS